MAIWVGPETAQEFSVEAWKKKMTEAVHQIIDRQSDEIRQIRERMDKIERFTAVARLFQRVEQLEKAINLDDTEV